MAEPIEDSDEAEPVPRPPRRRIVRRALGMLLLFLVGLGIYGWTQREEIAGDLITRELAKLGLKARYRIVSIGPRRQILADIVIGDPAHPDLTVERAETSLVPRFPFAAIGRIRLVRPRLFGTYVHGRLSFGALDPLIFRKTGKPFAFPDIELVLDDGRALLESDFGAVGFKAQGSGNLRGGFAGILAANAPQLAYQGCSATRATLYGKLSIDAEQPHFDGPVRLGTLDCPTEELALRDLAIKLETTIDRGLDGLDAKAGLSGGAIRYGTNRAGKVQGTTQLGWRDKALTAKYNLGLGAIDTPQMALASLALDGSVRSREGIKQIELQTDVAGTGLRPGAGLDAGLRDAAKSASGTLAGPMLEQIRAALAREAPGSALAANLTLRKSGDSLSLVMPQAQLRGRSGATLVALSRFQATSGGPAPQRFAGNFTTGGPGLPVISGQIESRGGAAGSLLRLKMAAYKAGEGSLEIPQMSLTQSRDGSIAIDGLALASGPIPGGSAKGLRVPLKGNWSSKTGLTLWPDCTNIAFERMDLASLALDRRSLTFCPPRGTAILRSDAKGLRIAVGTPSLELTGRLADTPITLRSGAVGIAYPGEIVAQAVDVVLGRAGGESRFRLAQVNARIEREAGGTFSGTEARLAAVPLDLVDATGAWRYIGGKLELTGASFRLLDRQAQARFHPLMAREATLELKDSKIVATALLREPKSDRAIVKADIVHDLNSGIGHADLDVAGVTFDDKLQPDTLSDIALGLVANAKGTVTGKGRIDWNPDTVTSSGEFSTQKLDLAASFGPVEGVSGTIHFTDLLGMITAPSQYIDIARFNPGIEVEAGRLTFEIRKDYQLAIKGGRWPFLGGTLVLEPTVTSMTATEPRHYTLAMDGIDAALFVQHMDLANFSATGSFDGRLPLVFDENGGRIEQGYLTSRPPGGNLSYVGALTYKDLSTMANYAFQSLKSLDFRKMDIALNGPLTGEIITKVKFDGISQGEGASKNFITRQIAKLPIQFNVNIKAPFYRLISSFRAIYDPAFIKDPRELGLVDANGNAIVRPAPPAPATKPEDLPSDEAPIQSPESEKSP